MKKFNELREQNNKFVYKSYGTLENEQTISLHFHYQLIESDKINDFHHKLSLNKNDKISTDLDFSNIIFHIGMAEAISYYKIATPKEFIIECGTLNDEQQAWFKKLYYNGLGEFIYLNNIAVTQDELLKFVIAFNGDDFKEIKVATQENNIIPIGGGKDSLVSYELLKDEFPESLMFSMNPIVASKAILDKHPDNSIELKRELDLEKILDFNKRGYLNGHIPFSSIVGFISIWLGLIYKTKYIVLSNESSANEENIIFNGLKVNHQYSKSVEFENDFRFYVSSFITKDVEYFSFLRPLDEIHIAKLFSQTKEHFFTFRSCNVGSKRNEWCGKCPKCLFTYIMLCNFIEDETLHKIFDKDMLDDSELQELFDGLSKSDEVKPFECVGTYDEVNYALSKKRATYTQDKLPFLLKNYKPVDIHYGLEVAFNGENNLPKKFKEILKANVEKLSF
ncbi:hypothetical protein GJV85_03135 [Sulfurimonas aquatica]|uniref:UDP-N-acetyl-alpha-D-muramoyl-L-alanyl-L-glutamate epimerase n=1 Tax=Sulfurimonas aquatica TaxID=2672570 RepID=A0A975AYW8_9BACT|nr:hypothetical protein [Sulfurimonas aquatica]QSZ41146.1 hypothetical protein GJV85_03135 [Sulfurimonas aquatica]